MLGRRWWLLIVAGIFCAAVSYAYFGSGYESACRSHFVFAEGMQPIAGPLYVAEKLGYWRELGLDVTLVPFSSGRLCLDAVLSGKAQAGTVAETPVMNAAFRGTPIAIIATIYDSDRNTKVLTLKSNGIDTPEKLKGRKVGVSLGTNGEYFMDLFLAHYGLRRTDLEVINLRPEDMAISIIHGNVDAIFTWEPHIQNAKDQLSDRTIVFNNDGLYTETYNVVVKVPLEKRSIKGTQPGPSRAGEGN